MIGILAVRDSGLAVGPLKSSYDGFQMPSAWLGRPDSFLEAVLDFVILLRGLE